jgi:hypothetical protein
VRIHIGSAKMRVKFFILARGARACTESTLSIIMTRLVRLLTKIYYKRLLEYEYFANYKQKQYKMYIISNTGNFTTFSQSFNSSKVHSKDVKKANARSLTSLHRTNNSEVNRSNMEFFQNLVYSGDSDIIFVNETWLKKDIYDLEILHSQVILFLGII